MTWFEIKAWAIEASGVGLSNDALHLPLGLVAYLVFAFALRRRAFGPAWALVPVALLQGINEGLDTLDWLRWTGGVRWTEMLMDTGATLGLPILIALAWSKRRRRQRLAQAKTCDRGSPQGQTSGRVIER
jgi:hypothetical protein